MECKIIFIFSAHSFTKKNVFYCQTPAAAPTPAAPTPSPPTAPAFAAVPTGTFTDSPISNIRRVSPQTTDPLYILYAYVRAFVTHTALFPACLFAAVLSRWLPRGWCSRSRLFLTIICLSMSTWTKFLNSGKNSMMWVNSVHMTWHDVNSTSQYS